MQNQLIDCQDVKEIWFQLVLYSNINSFFKYENLF